MKKIIIIPLLFISLILSAAKHYVAIGGGGTGTLLDPFGSITQVNAHTFVAGDSCLFNRGDTFVGTLTPGQSGSLGNYITFGSYGTGADPIITPNAVVGGITWAGYGVAGIYSTTDITYNPGNVLIGGVRKINKINDYWTTHTPADGRYGNLGALALMAVTEVQEYSMKSNGNVYFWDGLDAVYCYVSSTGTTYLRFRGGEDPNDSTFYIAAEESRGVYIYNKSYLRIDSLNVVGGEYGIEFDGSGSNHCIVQNCNIESSNLKIRTRNSCNNITINNNEFSNNNLSVYSPGAYTGSTGYTLAVYRHLYEFAKYRVDVSSSDNVDCAVKMVHVSDNIIIHDNTITDCIDGIYIQGEDCEVYDNTIVNNSSFGVYVHEDTDGTIIHGNYFYNSNFPFRFNYIDEGTARTITIYNNRVYIPDAGQVVYIYTNSSGISIITVYFYNNSFICKTGIALDNRYDDTAPDWATGFTFINNLFSVSSANTYGYSGMATNANLFTFNHNWISGDYVGTSGIAAWATDASNIQSDTTFWDHSIDPPDFTDIAGTDVIGAGIDVGLIYDAAGNVFLDPPAIGAYEIPPIPPTLVASIDVWGTGGATTITVEGATLQMLKKTLPVNATDTTVVWSVIEGTGDASISSTGLLTAQADGTVTARATASDASGIYGDEEITISNQSPDAGLPTVVTQSLSVIHSIWATSGGDVTDDGGAAVTDRGVCWGTSANPTTADSHNHESTGTGYFSSTMTGLKGNTTYHVRAFAINIQGTAYGSDVSFTTSKVSYLHSGGKKLTSNGKFIIISGN
jgi:parallel beta-helix repeat protein